mmetsp:Transcript_8746/g.17725  ORF Transcript_8746/g.17725 Transcript_8746/m.17725 type:complete len:98 (-) Transcript_8746:53-346(-)
MRGFPRPKRHAMMSGKVTSLQIPRFVLNKMSEFAHGGEEVPSSGYILEERDFAASTTSSSPGTTSISRWRSLEPSTCLKVGVLVGLGHVPEVLVLQL